MCGDMPKEKIVYSLQEKIEKKTRIFIFYSEKRKKPLHD